jgi:hypothetical protein
MFACHEDNGHGTYFCTPDKEMLVSLLMVGFVNDSTGQVNNFTSNTQPTPECLRQVMQKDVQLWSNLLWISGGLLKLGKCSIHQIHFDFQADGSPIMWGGIYGDPLMVQDALTATPVIIPAKLGYTPHKTLGHFKASAGQNTTQLWTLQSKSNIYSHQVATCTCNQHLQPALATSTCNHMDSWYFYSNVYVPSLGYVLPNCFFTKKQLTKVQRHALHSFLAKCGYNRNTHQSIVFAPIRLGSCGFLHLFLLKPDGSYMETSLPALEYPREAPLPPGAVVTCWQQTV